VRSDAKGSAATTGSNGISSRSDVKIPLGSTVPVPTLSPGRKWAFRILALVLLPALLLGMLEVALRLGGYGYSPAFFTKASIGGRDVLVENDRFSRRFFPPVLARIPSPIVMDAHKPADTTRIFILGESAALGDPRPQYGASRYLQVLLRERYAGRKFEVVNTAVTAINSHVVLPIARECAGHDGDIWIVYMGNNEMVGPFGAATVFGRQAAPWPMARLTAGVQRFRAGQLMMNLARALQSRSAKPTVWQGMEMFMKNTVPATDPRRETVYRNFQKNLADILRAGTGAGTKVILSTVAVNLKDCPPFQSQGLESLAEPARAEFTRHMAAAQEAQAKGSLDESRRSYEAALALFPQSAEVQYRLAECHVALTNNTAAREHFQRAVDLDILPFRTDTRINAEIIRAGERLAAQGVLLCDAAESLAGASPVKTSGKESFYEHVHLSFDGNYRLALAWAGEVERLLPETLKGGQTAAWCSQDQCERLLGLTDWNRQSTVEEVLRRLQGPPFNGQMRHKEKLQELQSWISRLVTQKAAADPARIRELYETAIASDSADHMLHENYAEFLEETKDYPAAIREREKVRDLIPHYYFSHLTLGRLLREQGKLEEAVASLLEALRLNPLSSDIRQELGRVYSRLSRWEPALKVLQEARALDREDPSTSLYLGEVLGKLGRKSEAIAAYREAVALRPGYWEAHYRLGEQLGQQGSIEEAAREFREVIKFNPGHARAHLNLGVALAKMGRLEEALRSFDAALKLDPQNSMALQFKQNTEAALRGKGR
jgi:tetratricopeptide (TPR) repeat protein